VDLVLPNITFLETSSSYLNIEGALLKTNKVLNKPYYSRSDWAILNALYIFMLNLINKIYDLNIKKKNVKYFV